MAIAEASTKRRAHVVLPKELLDEVDGLVGPRRRSQFTREAIEDKIVRQRRVEAFEEVVGSLKDDAPPPEWETSESTYEWVRSLRREWEASDPWATPQP